MAKLAVTRLRRQTNGVEESKFRERQNSRTQRKTDPKKKGEKERTAGTDGKHMEERDKEGGKGEMVATG